MNALKIAATGMMSQQMNVDVLSNNIANLNTTGFKRQRVSFHDLLYQNKAMPGATTSNAGTYAPTGAQIGLGVDAGSTYKVFEQGTMTRTDAPLDMGVQGRGFFKVTHPDGSSVYTRDGAFQLSDTGEIVTSQGFALDPSFTIPADATNLTISDSGIISYKQNETTTELGQITLSMFVNEAGLENIGGNLYRETIASGAPTDVNPGENGSGSLLQFHVENSNVDPIESVTDLITAQRAYELNSRVVSTADEMLNAVNQIR